MRQDVFFPRTKGGFAYVVQSGTLEQLNLMSYNTLFRA